jgi:hypothetical protein
MRAGTAAILGAMLVLVGPAGDATVSLPIAAGTARPDASRPGPIAAVEHARLGSPYAHGGVSGEALTAVVQRVCVICHNDRLQTGNLSLAAFDVAQAPAQAETAEKVIRKLRAGMMPPPGLPRPGGDTLALLAAELEARVDAAAAARPNPGGRTFQRLNRAEYESSIREVVGLEVNAGDYLPLDTKSANFDNIADVQLLSPTLLEAYLKAAAEISRLAVGDPDAPVTSATYTNAGYVSQWDRVEGAPYGTRGGISVVHNFPADGAYVFQLAFEHTTTGGFYGGVARGERIEVSINGVPVALLEVDRWMDVSDPNGVNMETDPVFVRAGPQRVSAAFVKTFEGPVEDLLSPHEWSLVDRQIGVDGYGITALAHLKDLVIVGPHNPTGVSETPSRRQIFSCRPTAPAEARPCAEQIVARLASKAFRRPLAEKDVAALMPFYESGAAERGFEFGVRTALQAILASPDFVFRIERAPGGARAGEAYRLSDLDLASRLSFFLWGAPPDEELLGQARDRKLSQSGVLAQQVKRMLADPRAEALGPRFAAQWLRLQDLDKVHPDRLQYPDFYQQLADDLRRETELFFYSFVRDDKSVLDLFTADHTFLNERLARHYGIRGVTGDRYRLVKYADDTRRGLLGHGSILTLTSHANRTSPVLRGKWVMEVLLGTPPPPPPPGVPDLEQTKGEQGGRVLTTRERMEQHRANPVCRSCHQFMDPIGLALDNFDVTGQWRIKENGTPLDTRGEMYDGTPVQNPADLRQALLKRPTPLLRTFTANLMAYALGRRVEYYDMPAVRAIVKQAEANGYRMSSFILGVVQSEAFRMKQVSPVAEDRGAGSQ